MTLQKIPDLLDEEIESHFDLALNSERRRSPKILHTQGDYHNKVFNFILSESYMHPHLHPGEEKIDKMYLVQGSFALILFDSKGGIDQSIILEEGKIESIEVPAFKWHTYLMLSDKVIIYETMDGVYSPETWKKMASWAPVENSMDASNYLSILKSKI